MERWGSPIARWTLLAAVLGSGMAFLDSTVVNVALPTIAEDLHADLADLQWVLDAYLVTLTALLLLGGALGDKYGRRRVFMIGVGAFAAASALCGIAPTTEHPHRGPRPSRESEPPCSCRAAWPCFRRRSARRIEGARSVRGRGSWALRARPGPSSADGSSTPRHGDGRSSSTCRWPASCCSPLATCPRASIRKRRAISTCSGPRWSPSASRP